MVQTRGSAAERNSGSKNPSSAKLDTSSKDSQGHIESASPQDLSVHHEQQQQHRQQHRNFSYVLSSGELEHEVDRRQLPPCSPTMTHNLQKYIESRNSKSPLKDIPPAGVPHIYHDYSCVPDEIDFDRKKTGGVSTFSSRPVVLKYKRPTCTFTFFRTYSFATFGCGFLPVFFCSTSYNS